MSAFLPIGHTVTIPAANAEPTMASGAVVELDGSGNVHNRLDGDEWNIRND